MVVGVPGAGIGGLFYLLCALWAPVRELWRVVVLRKPARMPGLVVRQAALALGILAGIWFAGWMVALIAFDPVEVSAGAASTRSNLLVSPAADAGLLAVRRLTQNVVTTRMFLVGFATLSWVLLSVQLLRVIVRGRTSVPLPRTAAPVPPAPRSLKPRPAK